MPKPKLTPEIKLQADAIVAPFNVERMRGKPGAHYINNYRCPRLCLGSQDDNQFESALPVDLCERLEPLGFRHLQVQQRALRFGGC